MKKTFGNYLTGFVNEDGSICIPCTGKPSTTDGTNGGIWLTEQMKAGKTKPGNRYAGAWKIIDEDTFYIKYPSPKQDKIDAALAAYAKWVDDKIKNGPKHPAKPKDDKKSDDKKEPKTDQKPEEKSEGKQPDKKPENKQPDKKPDKKQEDKKPEEKKEDQKSTLYPWQKDEKTWNDDFEKEFAAAMKSMS